MPKDRRQIRSRRVPHKLCVKRLKSLKPVPAQNFECGVSSGNSQDALAAPSCQLADGSSVRRSRRLSEKNDENNINTLCDYEQKNVVANQTGNPFTNRNVVQTIRFQIYKAAAVVKLISTGKYFENNNMESTGRQQYRSVKTEMQEYVFQPIPASEWVFKTPERQKIKEQKPKQTEMVPAFLHTTSKDKTLYEMKDDFNVEFKLKTKSMQNLIDFDVSCVRNTVKFSVHKKEREDVLMQFSPIAEEVDTEGFFKQPAELWQSHSSDQHIVPSPTFHVGKRLLTDRFQQSTGPFPRSLIKRLDFEDLTACCSSAFAGPNMDTLSSLHLQPGVSPFQN